jgi:hypothetical protein
MMERPKEEKLIFADVSDTLSALLGEKWKNLKAELCLRSGFASRNSA